MSEIHDTQLQLERDPSEDPLRRLRSQIEELRTVRQRLLGDARQLVRSYERQLAALDGDRPRPAGSDVYRPSPAPRDVDQPGPAPGRASAALASRPAYFAGLVTLNASGAHRLQTIQVLEDSLSRIRQVEGTYVRRWDRGELQLELRLSDGVELVGELNRVLPFAFAVRRATERDISLSLEGEGIDL